MMSVEKTLDSNNITRINDNDRQFVFIGTAHVSPKSAEEVKRILEEERPDSVCIELDSERYQAMTEKKSWSNTDFIKVIKEGKAGFMFVNILLSNYQQKLAKQFNIQSGQEMLQGIQSAHEIGAEIILADRNIQITFNRIWRGCSFWEKCKLVSSIIVSFFDHDAITEEELEELKSEDMLNAALSDLSDNFAGVKAYLVDERDIYLCEKIKNAPGKKIIAILGAAHIPGIVKNWNINHDISVLEKTPPKGKMGKIIGWSLPVFLIGLVILTFSFNVGSGLAQARNWLILTMAGAGIGTIISLAHPLTILTSIVMAPISALSPVLATGWFAGLMEAHIRKPKVTDFERLSNDLSNVKGLWKNKITRILLVVILANLGCAIGNIIGSINAVSIFLNTIFA